MRPLLVFSILFFCCADAHAGAVAARQKQMQGMQEQAQEQMIQQAIAERQQEEMQAYQQAMAQQQAAQMVAAQQQMQMQQAAQMIAQQQAMQVMVQRTQVKQVADQRDAMMMQAVGQARQQQMAEYAGAMVQRAAVEQTVAQVQAVQQAQVIQQVQQARAVQGAMAMQQAQGNQRPYEQVNPGDVKEVVDIADIWKAMDRDSRPWALMIDNQAKVATVSEFIDRLRKEGAKIQKSPAEYANTIDMAASQNPQMLRQPFKDLVRFMAIMEYDFDAGIDRDALAKRVLGDALYQSNKKRLGI